MSFKRIVAISLCSSWLIAGAMDTQKQTITIKQPVKYINSKPIIIPISTAQAKPVRLSMQQASALVHAYQSLHKPVGSVMQQLQQRLPACQQTAVPQSLQRYTNNASEYVYIKTSHQALLSARTTQIDKVGKPYAMYTNCICPAGGGKPVVEVICTNNPQDMVRVTTLIAQRYINQDKSNAVIESNLVMDDSVANMSGIPTIGSVVELSKTDQAKYHAMLQVIEGKIRYEDIDMCTEGLRKMDAEAFTHVYYANDDDPACMLHLRLYRHLII